MEKMNSGTLLELIEERIDKGHVQQPISDEEASTVMKHIFSGLCLMHERNYIHRDLKPENILINFSQDPETQKQIIVAKIADFGLSAEYKFNVFSGQENIDEKMGTILYMAPEQALG